MNPTAQAKPMLPKVEDHPAADVVIYDGDCIFCQRQVARLHRWDGGNRLAFVSLHHPWVLEHLPQLSREALMREMYVVTPAGDTYAGAGRSVI